MKCYNIDKTKPRLYARIGRNIVCPICSKIFYKSPSLNPKYCSKKCLGFANGKRLVGNKFAKGMPPRKTSFKKGMTPWNKGKKFPERSGKNHHWWKGGKTKYGNYIYIRKPEHPFNNSGYVCEHRLVMEKYIGRFLKPQEVVHHINGNKSDNRIKNLKLFSNNSKHMKFHTS